MSSDIPFQKRQNERIFRSDLALIRGSLNLRYLNAKIAAKQSSQRSDPEKRKQRRDDVERRWSEKKAAALREIKAHPITRVLTVLPGQLENISLFQESAKPGLQSLLTMFECVLENERKSITKNPQVLRKTASGASTELIISQLNNLLCIHAEWPGC